jgi:hypothetical protein
MKERTVSQGIEKSREIIRALLVRIVQAVVFCFDLEIPPRPKKVFNKYKLKELYFMFYNIF